MGTQGNRSSLIDSIKNRQTADKADGDYWCLADELDGRVRQSLRRLVMILPFGLVILTGHYLVNIKGEAWLSLLALIILLIFGAREILSEGLKSLIKGRPEQASLWLVAIILPTIVSMIAVIFHVNWPILFHLPVIFTIIIRLGQYLEALIKKKSQASMLTIADLGSGKANIRRQHILKEVNIDEVRLGDVVAVKPGEKVPIDGIIIRGQATIDESRLTGQLELVDKELGDFVLGGTFDKHGEFEFQVTSVGPETVLAQMLKFAEKAQAGYIGAQEKVKVWSSYYSWFVIILAVAWGAQKLIQHAPLGEAMMSTTGVLMIAAPLVWVSVIPSVVAMAVGRGLRDGIIIRRPSVLEKIRRLDMVIFDKMGTLTEGKPRITDVIAVSKGATSGWVLGVAAAVEAPSNHPLGDAILKHWNRSVRETNTFETVLGMGVRGIVEGKRIILGNQALTQKYNVTFGTATVERIKQLEESGKTLLFLARENTQLAGIVVTDNLIRANTREVITAVKKSGWRTILVSGDNTSVVKMVGEEIGVDEIVSLALPADKAEVARQYQGDGKTVAMIGSGESDMPAIVRADVGIVLSSDGKIESQHGQITIVNGNFKRAKMALDLGRLAVINAWQNFGLIIIYTVTFLILTLYGKIPIVLAPIIAIAFNVLVALNVRRLNFAKLKVIK
jgi:heavy metal translocating P-type ATPase